MNINLIGFTAAFATFFSVWLGHVSVRKIERATVNLWIPTCIAISLGIGLEVASYLTVSLTLSTICGILGLTFFWDAREFFRQQQRVQYGHAPANPKNPRHVRILADHPNATTYDWLDRDPRGSAYSSAEISSMKESAN